MASALPSGVAQPSKPLDTPFDHRSLLVVINWFLIATTILVVLTRCGTRWAVSRTLGLDDLLILISTVSHALSSGGANENDCCQLFAIGSAIAVTLGTSNGLGLLDWEVGTAAQVTALQKVSI